MRNAKFGRRRFLGVAGGALSMGAALTSGLVRPAPARAATGTRAYVGCYTSHGQGTGHGIGVADVESSTGALSVRSTVPVADPSFLALSPDGRFLYAVDEGPKEGSVTAVDLHGAQPRVLNTVAAQADGPTHLCVSPDGRHVVTANYGSGSISVLSVTGDGALGAITDVVQHTGTGPPDSDRTPGPHTHQVLFDPSGRWVLAVDLGVDAVYVYQLGVGKLRRHAQVAVTPGSGPRHLSFHPDGRRAYLANEVNSTVTVCDWQSDTGTLSPGQSLPADIDGGGPRNYPSEPVISRDGRLLYLANRGHDNIATFAIAGPLLVPLGTTPCGGVFPRDLTLSPDGRRLYSSNQKSNSVTWLDLDPLTGLPHAPSGRLDTGTATCVLFA
ncbi:lactonase family protein [Nocardia sp. NEAU-G5]|uniref:Lactonase family protein n=1 Tax=Nocardia albiluteola TaxID=2842303 RepID=A0ABS6AW31_9NOCA|nr:lactonase family protein [Nocardia albiluteola]MBU3061726.1 lactonase family protein [Nocardia albiluteola]